MKSRFQPDVDSGVALPPPVRLIDPEAYDASEQRFAASVEDKPPSRRFVVDVAKEPANNSPEESGSPQGERDENTGTQSTMGPVAEANLEAIAPAPSLQTELPGSQDPDAWRSEVADRVNSYRARRRPRAPRYPSLQLKFDPPEPSRTTQSAASHLEAPATSSRLAVAKTVAFQEEQLVQPETEAVDGLEQPEGGARILEFPRSAALPPPVFDELAEPVVDRPRILEVPDLLLPPPALGGILMEPVEEPEIERRPGFELPLQAAPMSKRLLAGALDSLLVLSAFAVFAYIFFRITSVVPSPPQAFGISVSLVALFWITYQYLLLVYTGTTPGLRLSRLQLNRFDGSPVPRKIRKWRALASILSGLSLALGYAWCFLDEDRLCWHDRITRTYMAPSGRLETNRVGTGL
jgi:uncharacterized RDD family membrane protein YckC